MTLAGPALIELDGLGRAYGAGMAGGHALRAVNLIIQAGEFVSVMGPSGSGKSTVMSIIGCLDTPTAGHYRFAGVDVASMNHTPRALLRRHYLGFVFQGFNLLPRTPALDNVELPLIYQGMKPGPRRERAHEALRKVGLAVRSILRNTLRSLLTVLGVVIGVGAERMAAPTAQRGMTVVSGNQNHATQLVGTDNRYPVASDWSLSEGREFQDSKLNTGAATCLLGATVRRTLFGSGNPPVGGVYHCFATDSYPYFQRCVKGEVDAGRAPAPQGQ